MNVETINSDNKLASWARFFRLHTLLPTALIPIISYITVKPLGVQSTLTIIYFAGLAHIFTCGLNDLVDYPIDKNAEDKQHRPLVSGEIDIWNAKYVLTFILMLSIFPAFFVSVKLVALMIVGLALSTAYNILSGVKVYADFIYVSSILAIFAVGPVIAGGYTKVTLLLFGAFVIHGFYQVQEGHMKDLVEDENNILQRLGLDVNPDRSVSYPKWFTGATLSLKLLEFSLISYAVLIINPANLQTVIGPLLSVLGLIYLVSTSMWLMPVFDRDAIVKWITIHELASIVTILIAVYSLDTAYVAFFIVATPLWLIVTNYFIHDDILSPDI